MIIFHYEQSLSIRANRQLVMCRPIERLMVLNKCQQAKLAMVGSYAVKQLSNGTHSYSVSEELMKLTFNQYGKILEIRVFKDKGYAFIR